MSFVFTSYSQLFFLSVTFFIGCGNDWIDVTVEGLQLQGLVQVKDCTAVLSSGTVMILGYFKKSQSSGWNLFSSKTEFLEPEFGGNGQGLGTVVPVGEAAIEIRADKQKGQLLVVTENTMYVFTYIPNTGTFEAPVSFKHSVLPSTVAILPSAIVGFSEAELCNKRAYASMHFFDQEENGKVPGAVIKAGHNLPLKRVHAKVASGNDSPLLIGYHDKDPPLLYVRKESKGRQVFEHVGHFKAGGPSQVSDVVANSTSALVLEMGGGMMFGIPDKEKGWKWHGPFDLPNVTNIAAGEDFFIAAGGTTCTFIRGVNDTDNESSATGASLETIRTKKLDLDDSSEISFVDCADCFACLAVTVGAVTASDHED